jgi:hypothetical protein
MEDDDLPHLVWWEMDQTDKKLDRSS